MSKKKESNFFWASYADLMTSLFFIMLVLFVLSVAMLKKQQRATTIELNAIKEVQNAVKELPKEYFSYQEQHKRFSLNKQIQFDPASSKIKPEYGEYLLNVGKSVQKLIESLKVKYADQDIRFMVVIEGMASKDNYLYNDELSYQRALSLYRFWEKNNIQFDSKICELQIAGSGTGGVGRELGRNEYKNQRFLIQVIPKIGDINIKD